MLELGPGEDSRTVGNSSRDRERKEAKEYRLKARKGNFIKESVGLYILWVLLARDTGLGLVASSEPDSSELLPVVPKELNEYRFVDRLEL